LKYFCSCCDEELEKGTTFYAVRDGKRLLYLHKECVLVLSGGEERIEECGVVIENDIYVNFHGDVYWFTPGTETLHRMGGPAVERADGGKFWYIDGKLHRKDGPAIEWADGSKEWHRNNKRHREGGPAYEGADGIKFWYLEDNVYTKEEHKAEMKKREGNKK